MRAYSVTSYKKSIFLLATTLLLLLSQCTTQNQTENSNQVESNASMETTIDDAHEKNIPLLTDMLEKMQQYRGDNYVKFDINQADESKYNQTDLHQAAYRGDVNMVKQLLDQKANVNAKAKNDTTPLHLAIYKGHTAVVRLLLDNRANIEAETTKLNRRPIHIAAAHGHTAIVEMLLLKKDLQADAKAYRGATALHLAANYGHKAIIELLVDKININQQDDDGLTPLHLAANRGSLDAIQYLLDKGADPCSRSARLFTPLHLAVEGGNILAVEKTLSYKKAGHEANIEVKSDNDVTPLHIAAYKGHVDMVDFLLKEGADINAKDKDEFTALHWAALEGHPAVVEFLLEQGVHPSHKATALKVAKTAPKAFNIKEGAKLKAYKEVKKLLKAKKKK